MKIWRKAGILALALAAWAGAWAGTAEGRPVISHTPVRVAVKGQPLGLRAVVRDAGGTVTGVSAYYAASRGMTPFRLDMSTAGAGIWYGSIPGHLIGPGEVDHRSGPQGDQQKIRPLRPFMAL